MEAHLAKAWEKLYRDQELGAGNFLFKAYHAYPDIDTEFLFSETPVIAPSGGSYAGFSLRSLRTFVGDLGGWYLSNNVKSGDYVGLYLSEGIKPFLHFLALNSIGAVPVLINGRMDPEIAVAYMSINGFAVLVYDGETQARWEIGDRLQGQRGLHAEFAESEQPHIPALLDEWWSVWPVSKRPDDTIMICHSSGTTGIPKAVIFGHDQFFRLKRERLQSFIEADAERLVTAMPSTHAAGISYLMTATLLQIPTLSMSTQTGHRAADLIAGFRPTIVTAFPQTYASLAGLCLPDRFLESVRRYYNTADCAHQTHISELLRLAPHARFTDMFGSSELGMSQFFKVSRAGDIAATRSVGTAGPCAECVILGRDGHVLPDGTPGYFGVRSPTITPGYYGRKRLTELTWLNGYWLTGDIGYRRPNGEFIHLDRIVDVIPTFLGMPAYTLVLEEHLLKNPLIHDVTVVGVRRGPLDEQAVIALVTPKGESAEAVGASEVLRWLLQAAPFCELGKLPDHVAAVAIVSADYVLPTGSTGKVLKNRVREAFWDLQRDYDQGDRSRLQQLLWNHEARH